MDKMPRSEAAPRKIAYVLGQNAIGGTELQSRWLVAGLRSRGERFDVFVVDGSAGLADLAEGGRAVSLGGGWPRGPWQLVQVARRTLALRRHLRRGGYTIVHGVMARGYVVAALASAGRRSIRLLASRRNLGVHRETSNVIERRLEKFSARRTDMFIANSTAVRDYWSALGHGEKDDWVVIPNALDDWRFEQVPPQELADAARLVSVGGLKAVKNHSQLLEVAADLNRRGHPVEVLLVGDGELRDALEARATALGVRLHVTGLVEDTRAWLGSAQVYVHASTSEGSSNAIAEAMAYGMAIVATDVGGTAEQVGDTARLVPPDDPAAMSAAIAAYLDDPALRERSGSLARAKADEELRASHILDRYISAYGTD